MDLRQLAALAAVMPARSPPRPGACTPSSQRLDPHRGSSASWERRWSTGPTVPSPRRARWWSTERRVHHELESLRSDVASMLHDVSGQVRLGCIGTAPLAAARPPAGDGRAPSTRPGGDRRRHDHVARPPGRERRPRPGRREPAAGRRRADHRAAVRRAARPRRAVRASPGEPRASSSPTWPTRAARARDAVPRRARPRAAHLGIQMRAQAEIDGVGLLAWLAFQGYGAAILPATAASGWIEISCRRIAVGLVAAFGRHRHARRGRPAAPAARSGPPSASWWRAPTRRGPAHPDRRGRAEPRDVDHSAVASAARKQPHQGAHRAREHHDHGQPHGRIRRDPDLRGRCRRRPPGASSSPTSGSTTRRS